MSKRTRKRWYDSDISKLKRMAGNFPTAQIAQELGRGPSATVVKVHELQLSRRRKSEVANRSNIDPGPAGMDLV
jgi:hypothetical protein